MHSLVLLTLASSAFAIPIASHDVVDAPAKVFTPVKALADANAKAFVPVKAAIANVDASYVNAANGDLSGNKVVAKRNVVHAPVGVLAPVKTTVDASAKVVAPVKADAANVELDRVNAANGLASNNHIAAKRDVVRAPVDAKAPVYAGVPSAVVKVGAPVKAAVANIDAKNVNAANGVGSQNGVNIKRDVVRAPVDVYAPVKAVVDATAKVAAPVDVALANVNLENVNVGNGLASNNHVLKRDVHAPVDAKAPVDAAADACADVYAPVHAAAGNVNVHEANIGNGIVSNNDIQ